MTPEIRLQLKPSSIDTLLREIKNYDQDSPQYLTAYVRIVQLAPSSVEYSKELERTIERLRRKIPPISTDEFRLSYKGSVKDAANLDILPAILWLAENENGDDALNLFLHAAKLGDSYAMLKVGQYYLRKGTSNDDVEGFGWLNRAYDAPNRNLEAGAYIGDCYLSGKGTKQDVQKAEEIIMPLANQNVVPAMTLAGRILQYKADLKRTEAGGGTNPQIQRKLEAQASELDRQARQWWEPAAEKDDWNASAHLGQFYEEGWGGVKKSEEEAEKRYKTGADHGNALSMFFYGLMIEKKPGRHSEAGQLISRAAAIGLPSAIKWCRESNVPIAEVTPTVESAEPEFRDLAVETDPPGATITLDEGPALKAPHIFNNVKFGTHQLTATWDDYEPIKQDIQVSKGMSSEIRLQLKPSQKKLGRRKKNTHSVVIPTVRSRETSPNAKEVRMRYSFEGESLVAFSAKEFELPTFFPPRATDRFPIPVHLAGENATLQQLADRLNEALKDAGYEGKCSYYWLDDLHGPGFAIVTHIEHIQPDGKPVLDQRWGFDLPRYGPLTLRSLLGALMHADPGRYRLMALVASRQPLIEKDTPMTPDQVEILNKGPSWLGDSPWKTVVATADFHLIAYVYEFERKSRSDDPVLMVSSDLTAEQHLQSTGLNDDIKKEFSNDVGGPEYLGQ